MRVKVIIERLEAVAWAEVEVEVDSSHPTDAIAIAEDLADNGGLEEGIVWHEDDGDAKFNPVFRGGLALGDAP